MFKSMDIGIDLGTANILVYVKGKGVVLKEPSVVAIDKVRNKVLAVGDDAREMLGRAPGSIVAIRPLKEGVIANYTVTQKLLAYAIEKVAGKSLFFDREAALAEADRAGIAVYGFPGARDETPGSC